MARTKFLAATLALLAPLAAPGVGQEQFFVAGKRHLPRGDDPTFAVAVGDVDGDGDADLVVGNDSDDADRLYLNDGSGCFVDATVGRLPLVNAFTFALALSDVDSDGDLDLVLANGSAPSAQNRLYLNDGTGTFVDVTSARMPRDFNVSNAVAVGDVDGDGDPDLLFGNGGNPGQRNRLYLNYGTGTFARAPAGSIPGRAYDTRAAVLGDVDGDGDLDAVLGNAWGFPGQRNRLWINDGVGRFTDATEALLPADTDFTNGLALEDVDGDGDLDLVSGNLLNRNRLYLNDGTGNFTDATLAAMPVDSDRTEALALVDVDLDGDRDLIVANSYQPDRLYLNDGGRFSDVSAARMPVALGDTQALAVGDVDGDGDVDAFLGSAGVPNGWQNALFVNDGGGTFADATRTNLPAVVAFSFALDAGDVDGDGDADLLVVDFQRGRSRLYLNDGNGDFDDATTRLPADADNSRDVAVADVDGDGDLDVVIANHGQNRLYLNDGTGAFADVTTARLPPDSDGTEALAVGDVDADGDVDIVLGGGGQNRLYENDGTGTFVDATALRLPPDNSFTFAMVLAEVDGDGDGDLVLGNLGEQNTLYLNDGAGVFTDVTTARMPSDSDLVYDVDAGDVDGDGDLDLVFAVGGQNDLYLNDGTGTFSNATSTRMPVDSDFSQATVMADLDGDGDLDLAFGNSSAQNRLYLNDGNGRFDDVTAFRMPRDRDRTNAARGVDVDADGDLDLVFANGSPHPDRIYTNLLRQLDAPKLVRRGGVWRLDVYARYGATRGSCVVLPLVAAGPGRVGLGALGTLLVDPASLVVLPAFVVGQPAGVGSVILPVPSGPGVVGVSLYAQALLLPATGAATLTNATIDTITR